MNKNSISLLKLESNSDDYYGDIQLNSDQKIDDVKQTQVKLHHQVNSCIKMQSQQKRPNDTHDCILMIQQLEDERKEIAFRSIAEKTRIRNKHNYIKTYCKRIEHKNSILDKQKKYINSLEQALQKIQGNIEEFKNGYNFINEVISNNTTVKQLEITNLQDLRDEQEYQQLEETSYEIQGKIDIQKKQYTATKQEKISQFPTSAENSIEYQNINEIPSDQSFSSDNLNKDHFNKGTWTERERYKYQQFYEENRDILDNFELCYKEKIFVKMAAYIGSRNSNQCRSFHKQLINKHNKLNRFRQNQ